MTTKQFKEFIKPFKQSYVADCMGISEAYLSQVMNGRHKVSNKTAKAMERFCTNHSCVVNYSC